MATVHGEPLHHSKGRRWRNCVSSGLEKGREERFEGAGNGRIVRGLKEMDANLASVCRLLTVLLHAYMLGISNSAVSEGSSGFSLETLFLMGAIRDG